MDSNFRIVFPLEFPIKELSSSMIKNLPDTRLPGAPRAYRGANASHVGLDLYTGKCGLEVASPSSGWIIALTSSEPFPDLKTRDEILKITEKVGFTPDPILMDLHGVSIVIFHGFDESGKGYYCRLSHLERLASDFKIGDFVNRGQIIGYVGASGTSAQFKTATEKEGGCHLHFEWHFIFNGADAVLGLETSDNGLKRELYSNLFTGPD